MTLEMYKMHYCNTHLPLNGRAKLTLNMQKREERDSRLSPEQWSQFWSKASKALHARSNLARFAEGTQIDLSWFEEVWSSIFGPEWYKRMPCTTDQTVKTIHYLTNLAKEAEDACKLPDPDPVTDKEAEDLIQTYLHTHPPRTRVGWGRRLRWQLQNGTAEGALAVLLAAVEALNEPSGDSESITRFGWGLLQELTLTEETEKQRIRGKNATV